MSGIDAIAQRMGLKTYDTALPQEWVHEVEARTGVYPVGMFVWSYDKAVMFGEPVALTPDAQKLLDAYNDSVAHDRR